MAHQPCLKQEDIYELADEAYAYMKAVRSFRSKLGPTISDKCLIDWVWHVIRYNSLRDLLKSVAPPDFEPTWFDDEDLVSGA